MFNCSNVCNIVGSSWMFIFFYFVFEWHLENVFAFGHPSTWEELRTQNCLMLLRPNTTYKWELHREQPEGNGFCQEATDKFLAIGCWSSYSKQFLPPLALLSLMILRFRSPARDHALLIACASFSLSRKRSLSKANESATTISLPSEKSAGSTGHLRPAESEGRCPASCPGPSSINKF